MTTPPGKQPTAQTPPDPREPKEGAEREAERWSNVAFVLVAAGGFGALIVGRFPQTVLLGLLALAGVGAAILARRAARRAGLLDQPAQGGPQRGPAQPQHGPAGSQHGPARPPGRGGPKQGSSAPDGSIPGVMPARTRPTLEQRTDRARVAVIVLGSVIAALHLLPALFWSTSMDRQQCLDDAITNQAMASCNHDLFSNLLG